MKDIKQAALYGFTIVVSECDNCKTALCSCKEAVNHEHVRNY
jgi:hypothetical protein